VGGTGGVKLRQLKNLGERKKTDANVSCLFRSVLELAEEKGKNALPKRNSSRGLEKAFGKVMCFYLPLSKEKGRSAKGAHYNLQLGGGGRQNKVKREKAALNTTFNKTWGGPKKKNIG